jgi:hypothetical protein
VREECYVLMGEICSPKILKHLNSGVVEAWEKKRKCFALISIFASKSQRIMIFRKSVPAPKAILTGHYSTSRLQICKQLKGKGVLERECFFPK